MSSSTAPSSVSQAAPVTTLATPPESQSAPVITQPAPVITQPAPMITQSAPVITQSAPVVTQPAPASVSEVSMEEGPGGSVGTWPQSGMGTSVSQFAGEPLPDYRRAFWPGATPLGGLGFGTTPTYNGPAPTFPPPPQQQWYLGQGASQFPPQLPQFPAPSPAIPAAAGAPPPLPPLGAGGDINLMFQTLSVNQNTQEAYIRELRAREQETLANQEVFRRKFKEEMRAADLLHDTEKV